MSSGKQRLAQPRRVSDIHVRLIGAGLIGGACPPVVNPISGRSGTFDSSLIGSRNPFPRNMAHVMLRRLAAPWNSDEITNRCWVGTAAGAVGAPNGRPLVIRSEAGTSAVPFFGDCCDRCDVRCRL